MALGRFPATGPEGVPLVDKDRIIKSNQRLGFNGLLLQLRGDWPFLRSLFNVPGWNNTHICWKCRADQHNFKVAHANAPWRSNRYGPGQFIKHLRDHGVVPSSIFKCPGFVLDMVVLDWLHVMDLGVSQDCLGNLFNDVLMLPGLDGKTKAQRLDWFWHEIREYYAIAKPPSVLDNLTEEMFRQPSKKNKLKAKGGEIRTWYHLLLISLDSWLFPLEDHIGRQRLLCSTGYMQL